MKPILWDERVRGGCESACCCSSPHQVHMTAGMAASFTPLRYSTSVLARFGVFQACICFTTILILSWLCWQLQPRLVMPVRHASLWTAMVMMMVVRRELGCS